MTGRLRGKARLLAGEDQALYVIVIVSFLHVAWSVLLGINPAAGHATPVQPVTDVCGGRYGAIAALGVTSALALGAAWQHRRLQDRSWLRALALVPQQFLLLVSATGGITAAVLGHYADGTVRPWPFILGDQLPVVLVAVLYTTAILAVGRAGRTP